MTTWLPYKIWAY